MHNLADRTRMPPVSLNHELKPSSTKDRSIYFFNNKPQFSCNIQRVTEYSTRSKLQDLRTALEFESRNYRNCLKGNKIK